MKIDILNRVQERNDDKLDKYLGLGYTLNFMDIERDYVYQYYFINLFFFYLISNFFFYLHINLPCYLNNQLIFS